MAASKKAFITGVAGFVGKYLAAHCVEKGFDVSGIDRWPSCGCAAVDYHDVDILDTAALARLFGAIRPDQVFHLAGISVPGDADRSPKSALDINIMGTVSVLDAVLQSCASSKVLVVGTSKQYGGGAAGGPVPEETPCAPTCFYGVSKYAAELCGMQYVRQHGMDVRFTRSFNHTGPGQSERFVCSDWVRQAAAIMLGKTAGRMRVGNTATSLDITDVRDVVRAYLLILEKGAQGEAYNVCSGKATPLAELLADVIARSGRTIAVEQDPARIGKNRAAEPLIGDRSKLTRVTGWEPEVPLAKTIDDLFCFWREELTRPPHPV